MFFFFFFEAQKTSYVKNSYTYNCFFGKSPRDILKKTLKVDRMGGEYE